jgi:branched-chain amino acid transport system substrate-binding protein
MKYTNKNQRFAITATLVVIVLMALTGCTGNVVKEQETFKIGFSGALTGSNAALGNSNQKGVAMAVQELNANGGINGLKVEVLYLDDKFEGKETLTNYQKFVNMDKVDVVLTTTYEGSLAVANFADSDEVVVINTIDTSEELAQLSEYNFAVGIYDEGIGHSVAEFIPKGAKVGIIYCNSDPFTELVKNSFVEKFQALGGKITKIESYEAQDADFKTQLIKLQELEHIALIGFDEGGLIIKQAKELGIKAKFVGIDTTSSDLFMTNSQGAAEGMHFTFWEAKDNNKVELFLAKYEEKYGNSPEQMLFTATGYDTVMLVAEAMKLNKPLKDALYEIKDFEGLSGSLTMDEDGIVRSVKESIFVRTKDGFHAI